MPLVSSGVEHGNLRELALARMKDLGTKVTECYFKILCLTINNSTTLISLYLMSSATQIYDEKTQGNEEESFRSHCFFPSTLSCQMFLVVCQLTRDLLISCLSVP